MKHIRLFEKFVKVKKAKIHSLSGIALVVDGKMLVVLAKKHSTQNNKWSIPKGHIEGESLSSALKELEEETGIILDKEYSEAKNIKYNKAGAKKDMNIYVYYKDKEDIQEYLNGWSVKPEYLDSSEIIGAKFYGKNALRRKMDVSMIEILNIIDFN
jgi:8-oxo-dGTP pyrophosphatase MutT (NUDIX family)